jgi:Zn-dependent protease
MRSSIRLGRIAGIEVGLNWSLLIIAGLLAAGLARNQFPFDAPGYGPAAYDLAGGVTAVLFLVAVLLHELGHAVVGRREGLIVGGITLWFMGGVTRLEGEAATPGAELRISGVGPLVSLLTAGIFALVHSIMAHHHMSPLGLTIFGWLAWINVALAIFNLLPAAPLDGGRILHAAVWRVTHNTRTATRVSSLAGVALGVILVIVGVIDTTRQGAFDGILYMAIGWFVIVAARSEGAADDVQQTLAGITAADVMRPVVLAPGWLTVQAFLEHYPAAYPGAVFMLDRWEDPTAGYAGLTTAERLTTVPAADRQAYRAMDVAAPMGDVVYAKPGDAVLDLLNKMKSHRPVLVIDGAHTVGGILPSDLERIVSQGRPQRPDQEPVH